MTAPSWRHQAVVGRLSAQLFAFFDPRGCHVLPGPLDVLLPDGDEPDELVRTVLQPDLSVICDLTRMHEHGCRSAPDLVIEVLSPSTAGRDHVLKRALYEQHGAREYWLVHPTDRVVTAYTRKTEGGFAPAEITEARGQWASTQWPELRVDWEQVFAEPGPPA